jgi:arylsulfatase A-like enzyme
VSFATEHTARPNVIFILTDDQGYGDLSCHGNPILQTPNLDRLHAEGVRFTDFHVSPTCSPTRSALMTGRHEFKNGVTHTILERERLCPSAITLAQVLKSAGYTTGIFGKWHLGDEPAYQPNRRGFDETFIHGAGGIGQTYEGSCGDAPGNTYFDPAILHNGRFVRTKGYCTDLFFGRATKWLEGVKGRQPFFCFITPNAPHAPLQVRPEDEARYRDKVTQPNVAKFYGMIANIDDNVGRLLDKLKEWNIERETLVIFMNDNGGTAGVRLFTAGMRGQKNTPWLGGTRAASLWRWPGQLQPSSVDRLCAHIDVLPTLAELAGAKLNAELLTQVEGRSLVPMLKDPTADWPARTLFTHIGRWPKGTDPNAHKYRQCSVRTPRWHLVCDANDGKRRWQLFDVNADPGEKTDLAEQQDAVVKELDAAYDRWWASLPPYLVNEQAVGPKVNPFKELYWRQFGGGPEPKPPVPNILWLTSEDHGPQLGCLGDAFATTANTDRLAARGMIYTRVWSCAPVCAPARTAIISGLYPPSTGSEHMRSMVLFPRDKQMFPQLLRAAGYYCTNRAKEDYNLAKPGQVWDASSAAAHWRNRRPGQPFFAVFNSEKSHESRLRVRPHVAVHDPAKVRVPAYHPDTPEVRRDWAQYYDTVTAADADLGQRLKELADDGLADDTIEYAFADHGPGMPRCKRSACNSGLHVPLVVFIPEKFRHLAPPDYWPGGKSERLVSFVDFAPTVLVLAGIEPPAWLQGHSFLGRAPERQPFAFGFRGRMDERVDLVRSATDGRFVYVRNYMPHRPHGQHVSYMFQTPTTQAWKALHDAGKLTPAQAAFWNRKPAEELYDLRTDPDEVVNLAQVPAHADTLLRLRKAQRELAAKIRDVGFLPEGELHGRKAGVSPYDLGHDEASYPFQRIFEMAELASMERADSMTVLKAGLRDADSAVRYWAATGMLIRGRDAVRTARAELRDALADRSLHVRVVAAEALAHHVEQAEQQTAVSQLVELASWEKHGVFVAIAALNSLDALSPLPPGVREAIGKLPTKAPSPHQRYDSYVPRLSADLLARPM